MKIKFSVNKKEKWANVAPFFLEYPERLQALCRAIPNKSPHINFEMLTIKDLLELVAGKTPHTLRRRYAEANVEEWAMIYNALFAGLEAFTNFLNSTAAPQTLDSKKLQNGTLAGNIEEVLLWSLREAYGLQTLEQAHKLTIYEYEIARKNAYNAAVVAYNVANDSKRRRL